MAKTLLNGVNELLKKTRVLDSDAGLLTSLSDSAKQTFIDSAVQALNESMDELYHTAEMSKPKQMKEATITLASGEQDYSLHSQMIVFRREYHLIDETNSHYIAVLDEDGYWQIVNSDINRDDTGLPSFAAISPIDGRLWFDRTPTATEAGRVYKYRYDKDLELIDKDDEFPFTDAVFRAIVPAAAQLWKLNHQQEFVEGVYRASMARAARLLRRTPHRTTWGKRRIGVNVTDPMNDAQVS